MNRRAFGAYPLRTHLTIRLMRLLAPVVVPVFYAFIRILPERMVSGCAGFVGKVLRLGMRERVLRNFGLVFGNITANADQFWNAHAQSVGLTVIEPFLLRRYDNDTMHRHILLDGEEHLQGVLREGKGAMLFVNHLGSIGTVAGGFGIRGYDIVIAGNAMPIEYVENEARRLYASVGAARALIGANLPYRAAEVFTRNGVFATFIDFSILSKRNAWIQFGNAELNANLGPALIALRNRTPVLCVTTSRLPDNHHRITVHPRLHIELTGDTMRDATALTAAGLSVLLGDLGNHPEQWWQWYTNRIRPTILTNLQRDVRVSRSENVHAAVTHE